MPGRLEIASRRTRLSLHRHRRKARHGRLRVARLRPDHARLRPPDARSTARLSEVGSRAPHRLRDRQTAQSRSGSGSAENRASRSRQCREYRLCASQAGDSLLQKLDPLSFSPEEEEGDLTHQWPRRVRAAAFDVERVTKTFYDGFKTEHAAFLKFVEGIPDDGDAALVCVCDAQPADVHLLHPEEGLPRRRPGLPAQPARRSSKAAGKDRFYRDFLCPLFFEGFAKRPSERPRAPNRAAPRQGAVPQRRHLPAPPDRASTRQDHPDSRRGLRAALRLLRRTTTGTWTSARCARDNEINPDVLGYIFEKYINQKQMGAYYTKEDITGYISQNTSSPSCSTPRRSAASPSKARQSVWRHRERPGPLHLPRSAPRRHRRRTARSVPESALPDFVQAGHARPRRRMLRPALQPGRGQHPRRGRPQPRPAHRDLARVRRSPPALPGAREKLAAGEVREINDLITYNLDISPVRPGRDRAARRPRSPARLLERHRAR